MIRSLLDSYGLVFIFTQLENVTLTSMTVCLLFEKQALFRSVDVAYMLNRDNTTRLANVCTFCAHLALVDSNALEVQYV